MSEVVALIAALTALVTAITGLLAAVAALLWSSRQQGRIEDLDRKVNGDSPRIEVK